MLNITKSVEYGLIAIRHINNNKNKITSTKEIANLYYLPYELLAKILQKLCKKKYLVAIKGPNGGYKMKKQLNSISLIKFIEDIEGPVGITKCSIDLECEQIEKCNIKSPIDKINQNIRTMLSNTSLSELTN